MLEGLDLPQQRGISEEHLRLAEALLFSADKPVSDAELAERFGEHVDLARLMEALRQRYAGRGIEVWHVAGGWLFRTAPDLATALRLQAFEQRKLSRAALEVLAIIAYHQPITRAEIENLRGVATSRGTLDVLLDTGWIKPGPRRQTPGRPVTWLTTEAFLIQFGLEGLDSLPGVDELKAAGLLDKRPAALVIPGLGLEDESAPDEVDGQEADDEAEPLY
ncbi:SMC-Scp complex subunit ScpB [Radicibacter daui]|uniref:SMC-Scp complex subunit ScpB n=1 Tax=Radicibacter daui TaxID=3064829 RepID=UPI004046932C